MLGDVHFSGKEPHQYAGDSYANKDKSWGPKPGKIRPHKGPRPWTNQNSKQKPEMLAAGKMAWGLILIEGNVLQAGRMIDFSGEKHTQRTSTP